MIRLSRRSLRSGGSDFGAREHEAAVDVVVDLVLEGHVAVARRGQGRGIVQAGHGGEVVQLVRREGERLSHHPRFLANPHASADSASAAANAAVAENAPTPSENSVSETEGGRAWKSTRFGRLEVVVMISSAGHVPLILMMMMNEALVRRAHNRAILVHAAPTAVIAIQGNLLASVQV